MMASTDDGRMTSDHRRVVVIVGGSGPIGDALSKVLVHCEQSVLNLDPASSIETTSLQSTINRLGKSPGSASVAIDATDQFALEEVAAELRYLELQVGGLVCMAAVNPPMTGMGDASILITYPIESWRNELDISLTSAFLSVQTFGSDLIRLQGSIVLVSSDLGLLGPDQRIYKTLGPGTQKSPAYTTSKHALIGLAHHVATTWAEFGVRCNVIAPGPVDHNIPGTLRNELHHRIPLGRLALPMEIAAGIRFLLSDEASFITGSTMVIDGGRTIW